MISSHAPIVTKKALNYAEVLYEIDSAGKSVASAAEIFKTREFLSAVENPQISFDEKCAVIDRLFDEKLSGFIKTICKNGDYSVFGMIGTAYTEVYCRYKNILFGYLEYAKPISDDEKDRLKSALRIKYKADDVRIEMVENQDIIGGFRLNIGDKIYDRSVLGVLERMKSELVRR